MFTCNALLSLTRHPLHHAQHQRPGEGSHPEAIQTELFPEKEQPYFKTCIAKLEGTYRERELQQHYVIDIYKEPAPDKGPMTADCVVRE